MVGRGAVAEALHGAGEGSADAAEFVVGGGVGGVEGDADVGEVVLFELVGGLCGDEGAVGGGDDVEVEGSGVCGEFEEVWAEERFAAGEEDGGDAEVGEVVEDGFAFGGGEFAFVFAGFGGGVAVDAFEVAGAGEVPDDDWAAVGGGFGDGHFLVWGRVDLGDGAAVAVWGGGGFEAGVEGADVEHCEPHGEE